MGNLNENPTWHAGVPYFEADAVLTGGPDCPDNAPIQALANRTRYLKEKVEEVQGDVGRHKESTDPHPQYMTPAEGDQRYLGLGGGTISGPLWLLFQGFKQLNAAGDGDFEIVHRGNGDVSIYVNHGANRIARFTQGGRMVLGEAVDNARDTLQVAGSVCAASPADGADNNQLTPTAWVNRRIAAALANLLGSSPAALDTLNELAAALGNDPHFATTVTNLLAGKADKANTLAGYGITNGLTRLETGQPLPTHNVGPIWHDDYASIMTWQAFTANGANYIGYASVLVGNLLADTQPTPRAGYIKSGTRNLSRTAYAALRGWAMHNGVMVAMGAWAAGSIMVADNDDGSTFRIYDVRGEFPRYWDDARGLDLGRAFGAWQRGSLGVGDDGNNVATMRFGGSTLAEVYGYDAVTLEQLNASYPTRAFLGSDTPASGDGGYNTSTPYWGVSRPTNVPLLATVKF